MLTSEVLRKAREVLVECGHCKGVLNDAEGRVCAMGAINQAITGDPRGFVFNDIDAEACSYIASAVGLNYGFGLGLGAQSDVVGWNNAGPRTVDEVLAAFAKAAELAEADEQKAARP